MKKLVLIRHGKSVWNLENRFTGWQDVELSDRGIVEAKEAGKLLRDEGYEFDMAFTSVLKRAIKTLWCVLEEMDLMWIPVKHAWRLNERHYGILQGLNKADTAKEYGDDQVMIWRRSYGTPPPLVAEDDPRYPGNEAKYNEIDRDDLPRGESLELTVERVVHQWKTEIAPRIREGKKVIIAAHGNSLRALVKYLDNMSEEEILKVNIPTGTPLVYELDDGLKPIRHYYLGDQEKIAAEKAAVANQGKAK